MFLKRLFMVLFALAAIQSNAQDKDVFKHSITTEKKPWTNTDFFNDPNNFQFAIVTDRTGGARDGVFEDGVKKLNLVMPEFVMSVGDLIEGYTDDVAEIEKEWKEFNGFVNQLKMPFFYLPGNHDITNPTMQKIWEEKFGRRYYHFVYKNVLFIAMDSNDAEGVGVDMSKEQVDYVKKAIADNPDVRWTFLFMHHPMWRVERIEGFTEIEEALEGRKYSMYAGHVHGYMHEIRQDRNYYVLATTGGGSQLRGPGFGEYDHITWMTFTDNGPIMANLKLDGIIGHDIVNEKTKELADVLVQNTKLDHLLLTNQGDVFENGTIYFNFKNESNEPLRVEGKFYHHHQVNILKPKFDEIIPAGGALKIEVPIESLKPEAYENLDPLSLAWTFSYTSEKYKELFLDGAYNLIVQPSKTNFIKPDITSFLAEKEVSIEMPEKGLQYRYTTSGNDPAVSASEFAAPFTVKKASTSVKLAVYNEKGQSTKVEEKVYRKVKPKQSVKVPRLQRGLKYSYYEGQWKNIPDYNSLTPIKTGVTTHFKVDELSPASDHYGLLFEGYIEVPEEDMYVFYTKSDDGSKLFIGGDLVVNNDGSHSTEVQIGAIALAKGYHKLRLEYFEDHGGERLEIGYVQGESREKILPADLEHYEGK